MNKTERLMAELLLEKSRVQHESLLPRPVSLGAFESNPDPAPLIHIFSLVADDVGADASGRWLARAPGPIPRDYWDDDGLLLLAQVKLIELPAHLLVGGPLTFEAYGESYSEDLAHAGSVADQLLEECSVLRFEGSLFYIESVHAHPFMAGQRSGLQLIDHAVRHLSRSSLDLVVLHAHPIRSIFTERSFRSTRKGDLTDYYQRLGFAVRDEADAEAPAMVRWARPGEDGVPRPVVTLVA